MTLLRQIQDAAIDSSTSLPTLLRKCKVLSSRLGSDEFKRWIDCELSGYPDSNDLPDYRVLDVTSKGHFIGPYGHELRNTDIPTFNIPEEIRETMERCYLTQPVAALEMLVSGSVKDNLEEPWNPNLVAYLGKKIYTSMKCMQAWKVIPRSGVVAAIDAVRTRVLNFVLEIEAQNPSAGEAAPNTNPVPMEKVSQIFTTFITGNVQNLAPGSSNVSQTATYTDQTNQEVLQKLAEAVTSAALPRETVESALSVIEGMKDSLGTPSFKQRYHAFMSVLADHMQVLGPVVAPFLPALSTLGT